MKNISVFIEVLQMITHKHFLAQWQGAFLWAYTTDTPYFPISTVISTVYATFSIFICYHHKF